MIQRAVNVVAVSLGAINNFNSVQMSKLFTLKSYDELRLLYNNLRKLTIKVALILTLITILSYQFIFRLIFEISEPVIYPMLILLTAQFISSVCGPAGYMCIMTDNCSAYSQFAIEGAVIFILTALLLSFLDLIGLAFSLGISQILINLRAFYFVKRQLK